MPPRTRTRSCSANTRGGRDVGRYAGYSYGEAWKKKLAAGDYRFLLEGFAQKRDYARKAAAAVDPALRRRMAALAQAVNVSGRRIVVFNPLPWPRDGEVDLPWSGPVTALSDVASRKTIAAAAGGGRLRFVAKNLPPLGYRTYVPSPRAPRGHVAPHATAQCLENERLRVTLDPARCGIRSIVDKRSGRELVNLQSRYALGQYLYERFDADQNARFTHAYVVSPTSGEMISHGKPGLPPASQCPYAAATAHDAAVEIHSDAVAATALLKAAPGGILRDATQLRVTLYAGVPCLDLEWSITAKTPDPWPEGGWLCFPLRADDPTFHLARLGNIVNPAKDLVPGSNHEIFCLNGGLLVQGPDANRTGICPIDAQLVSLEHPGLWRCSRDFVAHKPDVFVNLFNNVYSTNFAVDRRLVVVARATVARGGGRVDRGIAGGRFLGGPRCLPGSRFGRRAGQTVPALRRTDDREKVRRRGGWTSAPRVAGHGLRRQPLWRRDALTVVGTGRGFGRPHAAFARGLEFPHRAAVRLARSIRRIADRHFRAGHVGGDGSTHGALSLILQSPR